MSIRVIPEGQFIWGIPESDPPIPEGFRLVKKSDAFLMAVSPGGESFYVGKNVMHRAIPEMELQWTGKFCVGEKFNPETNE
jgi:hypothetical protein